MFIDSETLKRVNIYAPYKGRSRLDTPEIRAAVGVVEIDDPIPPEDFSDELYFRMESEDAPYVIYTKKPKPTKAQRMKKAAASYNEDLTGLQEQYLAALFSNEEETAAELQAEAATRKAEYQAELAQIRSE